MPSSRSPSQHRAALQFVRPPLSLPERGRLRLRHRQRLAAQRLRGGAVVDAVETHDRAPLDAGKAQDPADAAGDRHLAALGEQPRTGAGHIEAAVEAVRATHAAGSSGEGFRRAVIAPLPSVLWRRILRRQRPRGAQSTMSMTTRRLSSAAAALTTVRSAWAVRPPRPITLP